MKQFITTIVEEEYMSIGGFGHVFYDVLTAMFIAELCDIEYVHSPITTLGVQHHIGSNPGYTDDSVSWDTFLGFNIQSLPDLPKIKINFCDPFMSMDIDYVKNIILQQTKDVLFVQCNNCRIYPNEMYNYDQDVYLNVINKLRDQTYYLKHKTNTVNIAMHIRRGDWTSQPLDYNVNIIHILQSIDSNVDYNLNIYSLGTDEQLNEIRDILTPLSDRIIFHFNTDIYDTFKEILNADLVIGGHSNFPKIISLFNNNPIVFLPYHDGIVQPLGTQKRHKLYYLGNNIEAYNNRIETNIYCKKNKNEILCIMNEKLNS